ncbi:hypothetical protein [Methylobacterium sp. Gmos1]
MKRLRLTDFSIFSEDEGTSVFRSITPWIRNPKANVPDKTGIRESRLGLVQKVGQCPAATILENSDNPGRCFGPWITTLPPATYPNP